MSLVPQHKRGTTWDFSGPLLDAVGEPWDLTGWAVASKLRTPDGELIQAFICSVLDAPNGVIRVLAAAADTADWPIGRALTDVQLTSLDGAVVATPTVAVEVVINVT
ncbi:hypothetical protein [Nevskia sp.]|uniref:hypothetical protein n=1 Tax=Nevskia sp. TaxID=1929292 RepID=UPI0025E237B3|nr:hypothetical protein [Nevskia sp.]